MRFSHGLISILFFVASIVTHVSSAQAGVGDTAKAVAFKCNLYASGITLGSKVQIGPELLNTTVVLEGWISAFREGVFGYRKVWKLGKILHGKIVSIKGLNLELLTEDGILHQISLTSTAEMGSGNWNPENQTTVQLASPGRKAREQSSEVPVTYRGVSDLKSHLGAYVIVESKVYGKAEEGMLISYSDSGIVLADITDLSRRRVVPLSTSDGYPVLATVKIPFGKIPH